MEGDLLRIGGKRGVFLIDYGLESFWMRLILSGIFLLFILFIFLGC